MANRFKAKIEKNRLQTTLKLPSQNKKNMLRYFTGTNAKIFPPIDLIFLMLYLPALEFFIFVLLVTV